MNGEIVAQPRVAVTMEGRTRYGFLLSENVKEGTAQIRFLGPRGSSVIEVSKSEILGIVGKTFSSSFPSRPDIGECVIFFDHGRQRRGWVWDIECDGKVILTVGDEFIKRWVEELILMPLGRGWARLSESELEELDASPTNGRGNSFSKKGGDESTDEADQANLVRQASRGAERLRELMAKMANTQNGR